MRRFALLLIEALLMVFAITNPVLANEQPAALSGADLDAFVSDLLVWKERDRIDFLNDWTTEAFEQFKTLASAHGFTMENALLIRNGESVFEALDCCFGEVFGDDSRFWTLEQQYRRESIFVKLGLENHNACILPDENSLTETEAVELARQKIIDSSGWPESESEFGYFEIEDIDVCSRISISYFDYGNSVGSGGKHWFIGFYQNINGLVRWPDYPVQDEWYKVFEVDLREDLGIVQLTDYNDPYSMEAYWSDAQAAHDDKLLALWSLEDKQILYQTMKNLFVREVIRHGKLPESGYGQILAHVQSVPQTGELTAADAVRIAKAQLIAQGISEDELNAAQVGIYLWRDKGAKAVYHIEFYDSNVSLKYCNIEAENALLYSTDVIAATSATK